MIARQWKGIVAREKVDDYLKHLSEETFVSLKELKGFEKAMVLKSESVEGIEVIVLTIWDSIKSIKQFTGDDISIAIVPPKAQSMMKSFDKIASHFEIVLQA